MRKRFSLGHKSLQLDAARLLTEIAKGGIGFEVGESGPWCWVYRDWPYSPPDTFPDFVTYDGEYKDTDGMWPNPYSAYNWSIAIKKDGIYGISLDFLFDWTGSGLATNERVYPYIDCIVWDGVLGYGAIGLPDIYPYHFFDQFNTDPSQFLSICTSSIVPIHAHEDTSIKIYVSAEDYGSPDYDFEYQCEVQVLWLGDYPS